jgi:hypothetical protein
LKYLAKATKNLFSERREEAGHLSSFFPYLSETLRFCWSWHLPRAFRAGLPGFIGPVPPPLWIRELTQSIFKCRKSEFAAQWHR